MNEHHRPRVQATAGLRPRPVRTLAFLALAFLLPAVTAQAFWRASADSLFDEADLNFERGDHAEAARLYSETIATIESNGGSSPAAYFVDLAARARFLEARSHERAEEWETALAGYTLCLSELSEIEDYVRFRMAACHEGAGANEAAMSELRVIIDDGVDTAFDSAAVLELASLHEDAADYDMALQWYRMFLAEAESYDARALAHYRMGRTYEKRGDEDSAERDYAVAVNDFPRSRHSHDALKRGRRITRAFTDRYHQGLVLYNRRLYQDAAEFLTYYIRHNKEQEFTHEANYFLGRSHQRLGDFRTAARRFEDTIEAGPDAEYHDLAWSKLAYCRRASGRLEESLATYERFAERHPDRTAAADLLWEKARLQEENGMWGDAGDEFRRIVGAYPDSPRADDALFRAGLCLYKLKDHAGAAALFAGISADASGDAAARALFWSGKCLEALSRLGEAVAAYAEAVEASTDSYYGARAGARLRTLGYGDETPRAPRARHGGASVSSRPTLWDSEALDFAAWLAEWYDGVYFPADRVAIRSGVYADPAFRRADVFLALHMRNEALAELRSLEESIGRDPRALDILVDYCERMGFHKRAIVLAEKILAISPARSLSDSPAYLQKRICPRHFREIVERECAARSIDPHIEYSLIRQESLFEPTAVSWVGARGLSQIMPATGKWVARRLGHRGFNNSHLMDPETNIRFGTEYLAVQLGEFDGDVMRALAAYNGGPEASERWWGYGGGLDSDVFVEDVGYAQTNDYIRRVFLYSEVYRELYAPF